MKKYSKKMLVCLLFLMGILMVGCTNTAPQLSQMQIREITTKEIPADYKSTFKATMSILQDEGYTIENTDFDAGLIVGKIEQSQSVGFAETLLFGTGSRMSTVKISATVSEITKDITKLRINIQNKDTVSRQYRKDDYATKVLDKAIYDKLFNLIKVEAERIKAMQ